MKSKIEIIKQQYKTIERIPDSWKPTDFTAVLKLLEYDDVATLAENELEEMTILALSDLEPHEAAELLMQYIFSKDELNKGQIQNMGNEMQTEKAWEEYAGIELHKQFFIVGDLLYKTFGGGTFPHPEAVELTVQLTFANEHAVQEFKKSEPSNILKVIALGLPETVVLNRLYKEHLQEEEMEEASHILWQTQLESDGGLTLTYRIISSEYWVEAFKYTDPYTVNYATGDATFSL
ncbi:hypothetical protein ACFQO1_05905 [Jejudonia soesokkakensis]|uniref:DUF2313 domain-containing protein n=1 Tax=Jejudonia soesokkakensis TaxID=1323432 RepID=A0ABW2MQN8_9FLAO